MKWLGRISTILLGVISFIAVRTFNKNYQLLVVSNEDIAGLEEDFEELNKPSMDLRGTPTHVCVCGCEVFNLRVTFKDFEIATYMLDMECANCGSWATAPTPIDHTQE